jgi:hypothetical protein
MVARGEDTWFFLTADYAFGLALERDAANVVKSVVKSNGGKVLGAVRVPLNTQDFSSFMLQAQASKAKVVALANAGGDTQNAIKQSYEFGLQEQGKKLLALLLNITDVHSLGIRAAQGMIATEGFYWDMNDATRAFSKRFFEKEGHMIAVAAERGARRGHGGCVCSHGERRDRDHGDQRESGDEFPHDISLLGNIVQFPATARIAMPCSHHADKSLELKYIPRDFLVLRKTIKFNGRKVICYHLSFLGKYIRGSLYYEWRPPPWSNLDRGSGVGVESSRTRAGGEKQIDARKILNQTTTHGLSGNAKLLSHTAHPNPSRLVRRTDGKARPFRNRRTANRTA